MMPLSSNRNHQATGFLEVVEMHPFVGRVHLALSNGDGNRRDAMPHNPAGVHAAIIGHRLDLEAASLRRPNCQLHNRFVVTRVRKIHTLAQGRT